MGKIRIWLTAMVIVTGCLTGCGPTVQPAQTDPSTVPLTAAGPTETAAAPVVTAPEQTQPQSTEPSEPVDTYWMAASWSGEDTGEREPIKPDTWFVDLLVRADGTARFRDIHEGIALTDDSLLDLTWEQDQDGAYVFYGSLRPEPVLRGYAMDGVLTLDYYGLTVTMEKKPLPQFIHSPAELAGTWLLVSGETEGWAWEAMPAGLDSMVIRVNHIDGDLDLAADLEERDRFGELETAEYRQLVTVLEEPLYPGCGNDAWSVRIGVESPADANGYPLEPELYATLLDYNTMLVQTCYTLDGAPAVSYQTYWRFPALVSWMSHESMDLGLTNWSCTEYRDANGNWGPVPEELEDLLLVLDEDGSCVVFPDGETPLTGTWMLDHGGVLLLDGGDDFWFGGAVSGYFRETADGGENVYEMTLYYSGGLLRLMVSGCG